MAFLLVSFTFVAAQCNGGNNGNGYGNNGNGNNGYGNGNGNGNSNANANNPWANINAPQWLLNWLQNGGQIPLPLALIVIHEERTWGMQNFGLSQGQMLQKYLQGQLTIQFVSTAPPSLTFFMKLDGIGIITVIDQF